MKDASIGAAAVDGVGVQDRDASRPPHAGGRSNGALALCLFGLLFSVYLLTFSGVYHASDEMAMLVATDSLARRGAWDIELLRWMGEQQGSFGPDGHLYSRKGIGTTLLALPQYWLALQSARLGNVQAAMLSNAIVHALTGVLVYLLLRRLRYRQGVALGTALAFGLATMAWPYARYLFSESLAGFGLMLSFFALVCYGHGLAADSVHGDWAYPLLAGVGLGLALLARLNYAIIAPLLGLLLLLYLYRHHGKDWGAWLLPIFAFTAPVLVALGVAGWYNWIRFGSPLTTGYLPEERFSTPFFEGVYGLVLSPGKGFFWYSPILFAALIAWPAFFRQHRAEASLAAAVVVINVAFYASWYLWWAGHGWGPRFLVTILPFAVLSLALALEAATRHRAIAIGLGALVAISLAVQILGVAVDFNLYLEEVYARLGLYNPATLFDPAYSPLLRQWAYLRPETLDLAWARDGTLRWVPLLLGLGLVLASALAMWTAWRGKLRAWARGGFLVVLGLCAIVSLLCYTPSDDTARAARSLGSMEGAGEGAAHTVPPLTESFQNAYDGQLWVWGVAAKEEVGSEPSAVWVVGAGDPDPAPARFQTGAMRVDYYSWDPQAQESTLGQPFDLERLPVPPLQEARNLGNEIELIASQLERTTVHGGETVPLALYWRALADMDTSYTIFVQAINQADAKAGQIDGLPCAGGCPTTSWRPGDLVGERYELSIGPEAHPGRYQIIAGMYNLETGERLDWLDAQGSIVADHLRIGFVDLLP